MAQCKSADLDFADARKRILSGTGIYEVPCAARDRARRDIRGRLPRSVQRNRPRGMTLALTFDSNSAHDIPPRRRHIPAAICRGAGRHIPMAANLVTDWKCLTANGLSR